MSMNFKDAFELSGTTKKNHGYAAFYEEMLREVEVESVLEIGVYLGHSLHAWKMVWPTATIEAVDRDCRYDDSLDDEFAVYVGNSIKEVPHIIRGREYDVVIDDGDHHWKSQVKTLNNFIHMAKKFYVIEDITGQYAEDKLYENIPAELLERATLFTATGTPRTFTHSDYTEKNGQYRVMFIDMRNK